MSPRLGIPTVTREDLSNFHVRVFGAPAPANSLPQDPKTDCVNRKEYEDAAENEDDGLGYYPDGEKRTLTDEQVAMFRHSEIYSIFRKRQITTENRETEESPASQIVEEPGKGAPAAETSASSLQTFETYKGPMTDQEETSKGTYKRRKTHRFNDNSSRRSVRELDAIVAEDQELDYGGETPNDSAHRVPRSGYNSPTGALHPPSSGGRKIWWPIIKG